MRSNIVLCGFDTSKRSKPLPYRRILSVGVGAHDDPNIIKLIFAKAKIYRNFLLIFPKTTKTEKEIFMNETSRYVPNEDGYLSEKDTKSYYSRIGMFCFLLGAISFAVSLIISYLIVGFFPQILDNKQLLSIIDYLLSFVAIYCIATPIAFIALKPLPTANPNGGEMKIKHLIGALCICFAGMEIGSYFSNIIITFTESITGKTLVNPVESSLSTGNLMISALCVGIIFPILEELLFRKLLCGKLLPLGEKQAIIISAAIFGLIHGNLFQFAYAFLLGLIFGYVYVKTGKIIYTIIFHCIINLYGGVFAQYVLSKIPLEKLEEILDWIVENPDATSNIDLLLEKIGPYLGGLGLYMLYAYVMMGLAFAGIIVFIVIAVKNQITFNQAQLKTTKPASSFFLNAGVATALGFIVIRFLYSILA